MFHPPLYHHPDNVNINYEAPHYATLSAFSRVSLSGQNIFLSSLFSGGTR
jgi:hypothetical protein